MVIGKEKNILISMKTIFNFKNIKLIDLISLADIMQWIIKTKTWFCGVMVSTLDFESSDPSSNLGRT